MREKDELNTDEAGEVILMLAEAGFRKLTLSGGEPLLRGDLPQLARVAKRAGLNVGIVTNGSLLSDSMVGQLRDALDWVGLSVDSVNPVLNRSIGRIIGNRRTLRQEGLLAAAARVRQIGAHLKVNTVVSAANHHEDLGPLMVDLRVERWKILRVHHIQGENSLAYSEVRVGDAEFHAFVARARESAGDRVAICVEDEGEMENSYVMVDPWGRFLSNAEYRYRAGPQISDVGVEAALPALLPSLDAFRHRGGEYDW